MRAGTMEILFSTGSLATPKQAILHNTNLPTKKLNSPTSRGKKCSIALVLGTKGGSVKNKPG